MEEKKEPNKGDDDFKPLNKEEIEVKAKARIKQRKETDRNIKRKEFLCL